MVDRTRHYGNRREAEKLHGASLLDLLIEHYDQPIALTAATESDKQTGFKSIDDVPDK